MQQATITLPQQRPAEKVHRNVLTMFHNVQCAAYETDLACMPHMFLEDATHGFNTTPIAM